MRAHHVAFYGATVTADDRTTDGTPATSAADHEGIPQYEIRVKGHLGSRWAAWFDGLTLTSRDDGTTMIRGPVIDQAALHGLLQKLRDICLPLVSVTQIPLDACTQERN